MKMSLLMMTDLIGVTMNYLQIYLFDPYIEVNLRNDIVWMTVFTNINKKYDNDLFLFVVILSLIYF